MSRVGSGLRVDPDDGPASLPRRRAPRRRAAVTEVVVPAEAEGVFVAGHRPGAAGTLYLKGGRATRVSACLGRLPRASAAGGVDRDEPSLLRFEFRRADGGSGRKRP